MEAGTITLLIGLFLLVIYMACNICCIEKNETFRFIKTHKTEDEEQSPPPQDKENEENVVQT